MQNFLGSPTTFNNVGYRKVLSKDQELMGENHYLRVCRVSTYVYKHLPYMHSYLDISMHVDILIIVCECMLGWLL